MLILLRQGKLSKWFSGIGQEAIAVGRHRGAAAGRLHPADAPQPRRVHRPRASTCCALFRQLLGKDGGFTEGPRPHVPLRRARARRSSGMISHLGGDAAGGRRAGARGAARRRRSGWRRLHRRRRHERRRLPRGGEPRRGLEAAGALRHREQPVRPVDADAASSTRAATWPTRPSATACPGVVVDGNDVLAVYRAVAATRPPARGAATGPTLLEFKTFRMRGHEEASGTAYVPEGAVRGMGGEGPHRALRDSTRSPSRRPDGAPRRDAHARDAQGADRRPRGRGARRRPSPTRPPSASWPTSTRRAPACAEPEPSAIVPTAPRDALRRRDQRRAARGDAPRPARRAAGPGHRRVRRRLQGHRGASSRSSARRACATRRSSSRAPSAPPWASRSTASCRWSRCSSATSSPAASTRSSTTWRRPTTAGAPRCRWSSARRWAAARAPGRSTRRTSRRGSRTSPGLKVVAPATPYDAKGLLLAAFEDGNPVLYLEHKLLYRSAKGTVPGGLLHAADRPRARRAARGATPPSSPTGRAWRGRSRRRPRSRAEGIEIEVIDLRTLLPWDAETVLASVRKTGRALVLHEAPLTGGFGGEMAATIGQEAFEWLDAPVDARRPRSTRRCRSAKASRTSSCPRGGLPAAEFAGVLKGRLKPSLRLTTGAVPSLPSLVGVWTKGW